MKQTPSVNGRVENSVQAVRSCRTVRRIAHWCLVLSTLGQLLIEASITNMLSVLIAASISAATFHFVIRGGVIRLLPLPALIVLGFNISTMSGALIAQTLSLRSLVYNLQVPEITFALCALFQASLLGALFIIYSFSTLRLASRMINRRVFVRMGLMEAPSPVQLWLMGFLGLASMLWIVPGASGTTVQYGDIGAKFIGSLRYLTFAPFAIPILEKVFPPSRASTAGAASKSLLLGYFALILIIAIASNSRGFFALGVANLGMAAFLLMLLGQLCPTAQLKRGMLVGATISLMLAPILSDLAIAMVIVRAERTEVSSADLVTLTLSAFNDKPALERYRKLEQVLSGATDYDEDYLVSPFVSRFVQTKFFDNTLSYETVRTGANTQDLWGVTAAKALALLPTPVLQAFGLGVDKRDLEFSMGDALYYAQSGTGLGGYRTGSPIGHGMSLMGPFMFIAVIPLFLLVFIALQSLTLLVGSFVTISPVILLQLMHVYSLPTGDSLLDSITFVLRTLPQSILIYWMAFHGTRWASGLRKRRIGTFRALAPFRIARRTAQANTPDKPRYR